MGTQSVNTGLEVQLEPSNLSPSRQVEIPGWGMLVWEGDGRAIPSTLLKAKASTPSTAWVQGESDSLGEQWVSGLGAGLLPPLVLAGRWPGQEEKCM